jgi:hypothetical protein
MAEVPVFVVDAACTGIAVGIALGGPPAWVATAMLGTVAGVAGPARGSHTALTGLLGAQVVLTLARIAVLLAAFGVPSGLGDAGLVFAAMTLVGLLPIGPASGPVATMAAVGADTATAAAIGLALAATSVSGTLAYGASTLAITAIRRRRRRFRSPRPPEPAART